MSVSTVSLFSTLDQVNIYLEFFTIMTRKKSLHRVSKVHSEFILSWDLLVREVVLSPTLAANTREGEVALYLVPCP